jgi:hypothetical protein
MHSVDHNVSQERQAKVVLPMMHLASQFITLGSQAQSGQDISALQLGFYKDYLDGKDSQGNVTSTWNQAQSIQAELGQPQTGPDIPKAGQVFNKDLPFSIIEGPATDTACGILGSTFGQIFSIVTGPISYIVSGEILKEVTSSLAGWLSGAPINIITGAGAADGNYINYGSRASASDQYASAGGVQMNSGNETALKNTTALLDNADFQSKSIAYRIFNPYDSQTLASKVIDNYGSSSVAEGFASMIRNFGSIFTSGFKDLATMLSGITHAATQPYDYHGLKKVGFTAADLANPLFDNPFQNGCDVTGGCKKQDGTPISPTVSQSILGDPSQPNQDYINRVTACFGDTISYDGTMWNVDYGSAPVDTNSDSYTSSNCTDNSESWMRIRFWLIDTQTIEGFDCGTSNSSTADQSCSDIGGFASSGSSSTPSPTTATAGATIDMAHLYDDSTGVACAANTNDIGVYDGYHDNNKISVRLCAIPGTHSTGSESNGGYGITGANGEAIVNSRVSGDILAMVQAAAAAGIKPAEADSSFRTMAHQQCLASGACAASGPAAAPGTSNHQMGLAVDWSPSMYTWLANGNGDKFGLKALVPGEPWHWSPTGN